jgi:hypothetical protein
MAPAQKLWEIKKIIAEGIIDGQPHYLIKWRKCRVPFSEWIKWNYLKVSKERNGTYLVKWAPTWTKQSDVKRTAAFSVKKWEQKKLARPHLQGFRPPAHRRPAKKTKLRLPARDTAARSAVVVTDSDSKSESAADTSGMFLF